MGTPLCHPCKTPLDCPGGTACDNACCYVYAGTGPLKRNAVANSIITSLCIILSFSYDKEELKASPPPIFVDLCGGSDKICCFYAGMNDMTGDFGSKLVAASIDGKLNNENSSLLCLENSKKCSKYCCDRPDHCKRGACPKSAGRKGTIDKKRRSNLVKQIEEIVGIKSWTH